MSLDAWGLEAGIAVDVMSAREAFSHVIWHLPAVGEKGSIAGVEGTRQALLALLGDASSSPILVPLISVVAP
jgi:hypothetical protein